MTARGTRAIPIASAARAAVDVTTLGGFALGGPGIPLESGNERPLALLKLLIALGGRDVSVAQASDALWPDAEGHAAHRALTTNLHRLRRIIGPAAVTLRGGRLSLDSARCRVDALRLPAQLDALAKANDPAAIRRQADGLLGLYRGRFLPGDFDPSEIVSTRSRLHVQVVDGLASAADRLLCHEAGEEAIELLRKALGIDDRSEALYRLLMRAYVQLARWSDGVAAFERCREALREFHGVTPSSETMQVYRTCVERGGVARTAESAAPARSSEAEEERRQVTVAAVAATTMDAGLRRRVEEALTRHGGTVWNSSTGAVAAVFGVPNAHEDDAKRAVRACWNLIQDSRNSGDASLRAAIESGVASARRGGERNEVIVEGEPLAMAQRLLDATESSQVVMGESTRIQVAEYFGCEPGPITERGTTAWRISGETGADTHFEVSLLRGLAPFFGRREEMARLRQGLERAIDGEGAVILVSGDPGIGKSRLLYEFAASLDRERATLIEAACYAHGERTPYDPFVQVVRKLLRLDAAAPAEAQARDMAERLCALDPDLTRYVPYCQRLLSLPVTRTAGGTALASGAALRRSTQEAVGALIVRASHASALVLMLEDWHWSDDSSNDVLRYLCGLVPSHRVLIVLTQRAAYASRERETAGLEMVRLGPLAEDVGLALVRNRLRGHDVPDRLARLVQQRSAGNPFFIEEICHGLRLEADTRGRSRSITEGFVIPATVQGMVRNRLDSLDHASREAALSASVIGREFPLRVLLQVHENRAGLEDALDRLKACDLIHQTGVLPEVEYRFKHALTQFVAYEALAPARRRALHARTGETIERLHIDRIDEHAESLARHFAAAEEIEQAVKYLTLAGDKAARAHAAAAAVAHYGRAIGLLDARMPSPRIREQRIDLSCKWAEVTQYVSARESLKVLKRSLGLARQLGDARREARMHYWIGRTHHVTGAPALALRAFRRSLARVGARRDAELAAQIQAGMGRATFISGDLPASVRALEQALPGLDFERDPAESIYSTSYLGLALSQQGMFDRCFAVHDEALRLARTVGDRSQEASALLRIALSRVAMGDWTGAISVAREAAALSERVEMPMVTGWSIFNEGQARFMLGEQDEGIALAERGLRAVEGSGSHLGFSLFLASLADLYALAGRYDSATQIAARALALRREGAGLGVYFAYHALALSAEQRVSGDVRLARSHLGSAHRIARASGARPAVAIGRLRKAELEARQAALEPARAALGDALAGFESLGMTWWLGRARRLAEKLRSGR